VKCAPVLFIALAALAVGSLAPAAAKGGKPPQDIYYLMDLLKSKDVQERRSTAQSLGAMGFDVATPALVAALDDDDAKVRLYAAEALGKIGDKRAVDPLLAKLPAEEAGVKRFVLGALGKLKDPRALAPMVAELQTANDGDVRASAAYGLGELGDAGAVEPLVAALGDDYKWVRYEACGALGRLKATPARDALAAAAKGDADEQVRAAAAKALAKLDE